MSNFKFEELEVLAFNNLNPSKGDIATILTSTLGILGHMKNSKKMDWRRTDESIRFHCTRIAGVLNRVYLDDGIFFNESIAVAFAKRAEIVEAIYKQSGYNGMSHLFNYFIEAKKNALTESHAFKLFSLLTVRNARKDVLLNLPNLPLQFSLVAAIGLAGSASHALTAKATDNYRFVVNFLKNLQNQKLPASSTALIGMLTPAYMHSTYSTDKDRHDIKHVLNRLIQNFVSNQQIKSNLPQNFKTKKINGKPVILVVNDIFKRAHAMTRCLTTFIRGLKVKYHLVLVHGVAGTDKTALEEFDETLLFDFEKDLKSTIHRLRQYGATMAFFPSVGMNISSVILSNLRIAKIQSFALGHPATTKSPFMDYALVEKFTYIEPNDYSEKIIVRYEGPTSFTKHPDMEEVVERGPKESDTIVIGVASKLMKLNYEFLQLCQSISDGAKKKVIFHLFPNVETPLLDFITTEIHENLPGAVVKESESYDKYLSEISECDFFISTYPFGNTNGNVDVLLQGKPIVVRNGNEVFSQIDVGFIKELGLPDWLICETDDDLIETAIRIADDYETRKSLYEEIKSKNVGDTFFAIEEGRVKTQSLITIDWVIDNHQKLQKSKMQEFEVGSDIE